ncbi:hypothetical protein [Enterococcus sp. AZ163]|uniref:hypothetical protein n=1 Tax=Enterococcus sp. AZ163 TaxID=2774638 RepID=UPI003D264EF9
MTEKEYPYSYEVFEDLHLNNEEKNFNNLSVKDLSVQEEIKLSESETQYNFNNDCSIILEKEPVKLDGDHIVGQKTTLYCNKPFDLLVEVREFDEPTDVAFLYSSTFILNIIV